MPYIIETLYPWADEREPARRARARRAVATLDEAQLAAHDAVEAHRSDLYSDRAKMSRAVNASLKLPESGGSIGPLPDGTVIVVEPIGFGTLAAHAGFAQWSDERRPAEIVDAFNAAQVS